MNDQDQPQSPLPENLRAGHLNAETIRSLDKAMRPSPERFAEMIRSIVYKKQWSRPFLAAIMSIPERELRFYEFGQKTIPGPTARLLWHLYTMDTAPEIAFSPLHMATWGNITPRPVQVKRHLTPEAKAAIVATLRACVESKYKLPPKKLTRKQMAEYVSASTQTADRLAKLAGYRFGSGFCRKYRQKSKKPFLKPESIWMNIDWRLSYTELAKKTNCTPRSVYHTKLKFRKLKPGTLARHIQNCGLNPDWFRPFLSQWAMKKIKKKNNISLAPDAENNILRDANEETAPSETEQRTPQGELQRDEGKLEIPREDEAQGTPKDKGD